MKKLNIITLLTVFAVGAAFANNAEYAITATANTNTVILPPRSAQLTADSGWIASTAFTQGQILFNVANSEYYMVLVAGTTSTNAPTGVSGDTEANGTATLIHCQLTGREKAIITQESDSKMWYQSGFTSSTNGGVYAFSEGQAYSTSEDGALSVWVATEVKLNIKDK